jgi:hypothetical protein
MFNWSFRNWNSFFHNDSLSRELIGLNFKCDEWQEYLLKVTDVVPNMASPVLKSILTIHLTNIGFTLTHDDLSVMLIDQQDPTNFRHLNIVKIDNTNGN